MKKVIVSIGLIAMVNAKTFAQDSLKSKLTLKQSVETAIANNLQVKQTDLQLQTSTVNLKQAKANVLPDLFGNLGHGVNAGRSIDPFTNSYINQNVIFGNYSVSSGVVLFNGFQLKNLIKQNQLDFEASKMDLQQTKENIMLNVILAYLQILTNKEQLLQARNQVEVSRKQIDRLNIMNNAGAITPTELYDLKGQLANDELSIINSQNALDAAKLSLSQLMNVPYDKNLDVEKFDPSEFAINYAGDPGSIFETSARQLSLIKAAEFRRQSSTQAVQVARAGFYPIVGLSGSLNTNFSNAARRDVALNTVEVASSDYVNINNAKVPVVTQRTNFETQNIPYFDQFKNNYSTSLFMSVRVPILNGYRARNRVALAKIDQKNAEYTAQTIKTQLSQNIEQAYFSMTAAANRYKTLLQQVADFSELFRTAEVRFNAGVLTQVDYLIAKNNVDRARINLISAKYDYLFRTKILDYYKGVLVL